MGCTYMQQMIDHSRAYHLLFSLPPPPPPPIGLKQTPPLLPIMDLMDVFFFPNVFPILLKRVVEFTHYERPKKRKEIFLLSVGEVYSNRYQMIAR